MHGPFLSSQGPWTINRETSAWRRGLVFSSGISAHTRESILYAQSGLPILDVLSMVTKMWAVGFPLLVCRICKWFYINQIRKLPLLLHYKNYSLVRTTIHFLNMALIVQKKITTNSTSENNDLGVSPRHLLNWMSFNKRWYFSWKTWTKISGRSATVSPERRAFLISVHSSLQYMERRKSGGPNRAITAKVSRKCSFFACFDSNIILNNWRRENDCSFKV